MLQGVDHRPRLFVSATARLHRQQTGDILCPDPCHIDIVSNGKAVNILSTFDIKWLETLEAYCHKVGVVWMVNGIGVPAGIRRILNDWRGHAESITQFLINVL
jgi:hypothetical protein